MLQNNNIWIDMNGTEISFHSILMGTMILQTPQGYEEAVDNVLEFWSFGKTEIYKFATFF